MTAPEYPAAAVGARVRMLMPSGDGFYATDAAGTVFRAGCREDGSMGFGVRWDGGRETHVPCAHWLVPEDVPRDGDGFLKGDPPGPAVADFLASLARYGCSWHGDVRETSAWHAEQPGDSGWWDAKGRPPVFSLTVRKLCEYGEAA